MIPAIQKIISGQLSQINSGSDISHPQVLVLSPSQVVADEIQLEAMNLCLQTNCRSVVVYGGW